MVSMELMSSSSVSHTYSKLLMQHITASLPESPEAYVGAQTRRGGGTWTIVPLTPTGQVAMGMPGLCFAQLV